MDKTVKTPYLTFDGSIMPNRNANLEDSDYITDYGIHAIDTLPAWYNDTPLDLYLQDWIMTKELNEDGELNEDRGPTWYLLETKEGETKAYYTPRMKFKQMKL